MEKSASDPFARPPTLSTRAASSSGPLEEDSHQAAPKAEPWAFGISLTTSSTTTTSTNPPKLQSDSAATRQVPDMYSPPVFNGAFPDPEKWQFNVNFRSEVRSPKMRYISDVNYFLNTSFVFPNPPFLKLLSFNE